MTDEDETPDEVTSEAEAFFGALENGDLPAALAYLQKLKHLEKPDIIRLAEYLDGDPLLADFHKFKLVLKRRRAGKPTRLYYDQKALSFARGLSVDLLYQQTGNLESAIATLSKNHDVSRTTLMNDRAYYKRKAASKGTG